MTRSSQLNYLMLAYMIQLLLRNISAVYFFVLKYNSQTLLLLSVTRKFIFSLINKKRKSLKIAPTLVLSLKVFGNAKFNNDYSFYTLDTERK